jgi:hypothetical protein
MADDFTRTKFLWLDQVATDPAVPASAFRFSYIIASKFLNRQTGDAYPSQETLAKLLGVSTSRAVRYLADHLVSGGHLEVTAAHGRGLTNRYRPVLKTAAEPVADSGGQDVDDHDNMVTALGGSKEVPSKAVKTNFNDNRPDEPVSDQGGIPDGDDITPNFDGWWSHYPKKVSKPAARKAYDRIVTTGVASPAELLSGVLRYAATRTDQDPRYTKNPDGWLNGKRWTDEVDVTPQGGAPEQRNGSLSWTEIALEGLRK